jgi:hypothetical protein
VGSSTELELPTEFEGDVVMHALLRDEMVFWRLFEKFVRNFYRTPVPTARTRGRRCRMAS